MKGLLLSFTLLLSFVCIVKAQLPVDKNTGKVTYIEVVDATGMTAKDIYKAAKEWGLKKGMAVKKEDEATGELVFEGALPVDYQGTKGRLEKGNVNYTYSIFIKEGKFRYIATDFVHVAGDPSMGSGGKIENVSAECGPGRMTAASWQLIKKKTQGGMETQNADLKRVIKEIQNDPAKKSDW